MAALLGVGRGSTAAPRQPALVRPSRNSPTQPNCCLKQMPKTAASVHRHTRTQILDES